MSISNNTTKLQSLMDKINALPEAENLDEEISTQTTLISEQDAKIAELAEILADKASVSYPTLSNPATAENLQEGYELIDSDGNVIVGTHVCSGGGVAIETWTGTVSGASGLGEMPDYTFHYIDENLTHQTMIVEPRSEYTITIVAGTFIYQGNDMSEYGLILVPSSNNFAL